MRNNPPGLPHHLSNILGRVHNCNRCFVTATRSARLTARSWARLCYFRCFLHIDAALGASAVSLEGPSTVALMTTLVVPILILDGEIGRIVQVLVDRVAVLSSLTGELPGWNR